VAAYFGLIPHTAQRQAEKLPPQGPGDGTAQRGLACARWPHKAEDGPLGIGFEFSDGQVFDDTFLYFLQVVMVFIQHTLGVLDVQHVFRTVVPRQGRDPVQVSRSDRVLGRRRVHPLQALQFPLGFLFCLFRKVLLSNLGPILLDFYLALILFTQLFLDRFKLLTQVKLPLALVHVLLDLRLDLLSQFKDLKLSVDQAGNLFQTFLHVLGLEGLLLFVFAHVEAGGDQVCQHSALIKGLGQGSHLLRKVRRKFEHLVEQAHEVAHHGNHFNVLNAFLRNRLNPRVEIRLL